MYKMKSMLAGIVAAGLSTFSTLSTADVGSVAAGIKVGQAMVSAFDGIPNITVEEDTAVGINLGYSFAPQWTAELEFVSGTTEVSGPAASLDVDMETIAAYATYRSSGPIYFVARVGYVNLDLSAPEVGDESDSGLSYGIGGGYRLSSTLGVEIDYTIVDQDADWLLLSARYYF